MNHYCRDRVCVLPNGRLTAFFAATWSCLQLLKLRLRCHWACCL